MKRNINTTALSKDYILSKISEESIAAKYLDIPIETIINCITTGDFINSPLREDNHPSFGFTINNKGKLKMKDFAGYFQGDVFDLVAYILSIINGKQVVVNNKQDFYFILKHIAYTFSDIIDGKAIDIRKTPKTDMTKASKAGILKLHKSGGKFMTIESSKEQFGVNNGYTDELELVFENGVLYRDQTFEEIRQIANSYL